MGRPRLSLSWHGVRWLIMRDPVKTRRAWETFITDELAERLKAQRQRQTDQEYVLPGVLRQTISCSFLRAAKRTGLKQLSKPSIRSSLGNRHRIHTYPLKKFFFIQAIAEVGDQMAQAWCGRKAYLSNYLRLPLEDRQRLYLRLMPKITIFTQDVPKTEDRLRDRLRKKGLSDNVIDDVLEGLDLK